MIKRFLLSVWSHFKFSSYTHAHNVIQGISQITQPFSVDVVLGQEFSVVVYYYEVCLALDKYLGIFEIFLLYL